ncbi:hypothetical protein AWZ03_007641 [Drosophila navojoa]|uniref:Uncharacterized protein n=2 Tax=mojavensis species complex TaxID=198037 RepID=B4KJD1_DROMO|nr:5'-3' exoribonuclease 2 homolog [Drosophila mojavensis]XP_030241078.1 5'-3' exoribonuclease 2 homolog [Drosophila navojoa]EDW12506.1 uncharacterized protein Dmoj_GI24421 [Drosophila mojavensis]TDG45921.1 hypothetical protein AWZ03_007641 [Drosophila navojoa]
MDYGQGNGGGPYQSMEGYGMSAPDGQAPEMGQDYMQSRGGYGGGMQSYDDGRNCQGGSASFGGPGYRSPLRYSKVLREMNSRNGLYSPTDQRSGRGNGDYYNSLPGIGGPEGQMYGQPRQGGNPYY